MEHHEIVNAISRMIPKEYYDMICEVYGANRSLEYFMLTGGVIGSAQGWQNPAVINEHNVVCVSDRTCIVGLTQEEKTGEVALYILHTEKWEPENENELRPSGSMKIGDDIYFPGQSIMSIRVGVDNVKGFFQRYHDDLTISFTTRDLLTGIFDLHKGFNAMHFCPQMNNVHVINDIVRQYNDPFILDDQTFILQVHMTLGSNN